MKSTNLIFSIAVCALSLTACNREQEIYNPTDHVLPDDAQRMSETEVARLIKMAGSRRGWECNSIGPNRIRCQRSRRHHKAIVDVTYNYRTFSIHHVSTNNMRENDNRVHRNYNRWVHNLEQDIVDALSTRGVRQKAK